MRPPSPPQQGLTAWQTLKMFDELSVKANEAIGIRIIGIYLPNNQAGLSWKNAYSDPEFRWSTTTLPIFQDRYSFEHAATMLGRTHIKDAETGEYLNLNVLDIDCEKVKNRLSISIEQLLDASSWDWVTDRVRELVKALLAGNGVVNGDYSLTLLDILKRSTYVTKTRKIFGHHIYWLSKEQREPVGTMDCLNGSEFEIKTNDKLGLCTLPGSGHKDDPINFRYQAIGRTDCILVNDIFYDLLLEMFKDCLVERKSRNVTDVADSNTTTTTTNSTTTTTTRTPKDSTSKRVVNVRNLVTLSDSTVKATAGQLSQFIERGYRQVFYLRFSGMLFHSRISDESASRIIVKMCAITGDEEAYQRQTALTNTYEKGFNGEEVEGAPTLAELIADKVEDQDLFSATLMLDNLKAVWRNDKKVKQQREESTLVNVSVAEAKRMQSGYVKVRGSIVGLSTVHQMIISVTGSCNDCGYNNKIEYDVPQFKSHVKDHTKCPSYNKDHIGTHR